MREGLTRSWRVHFIWVLRRPLFIPCLLAMSLASAGCSAGREIPVVTTVPVGQWPEDVVFDPGLGQLFVADEGSATITVPGTKGRWFILQTGHRAPHIRE